MDNVIAIIIQYPGKSDVCGRVNQNIVSLSPFALMLAPTFRSASLFLIVYGCMFPTVFATITGMAMPRSIIEKGLNRMKEALKENQVCK